jgi:hypothetical protein
LVQHTKTGKIHQITTKYYQITTKYTKLPQNIPNYHKIYQITTNYTKLPQNIPNGFKKDPHLQLQDPPKMTQIWTFGLKTLDQGVPMS